MKRTCRRFRKNIFEKFGGGLLLSLTSISLIGVGFSSWVIRPLSSAEVNIEVSAGDVINLADFFQVSTEQINFFQFTADGICDITNDMIGMNGAIEIPIILHDIDKAFSEIDTLRTERRLPLIINFNYFDAKDTSYDFLKSVSSFSFGYKGPSSNSYEYSNYAFSESGNSITSSFSIYNLENTSVRSYGRFKFYFTFDKKEWKSIHSHLSQGDMRIFFSMKVGS
ncbi:MAG: hypothetical protein SO148_01350 [Candidatus Onthovivens sp.]|nr:hypothetical protein [Candidatus Onthovivens sp.]